LKESQQKKMVMLHIRPIHGALNLFDSAATKMPISRCFSQMIGNQGPEKHRAYKSGIQIARLQPTVFTLWL